MRVTWKVMFVLDFNTGLANSPKGFSEIYYDLKSKQV
jgi:hypothetical protein